MSRGLNSKILICATEDWFVVSHFLPLLEAARAAAREVVVAARFGDKREEIEAMGVRTVPLDFQRRGFGIFRQIGVLLQLLQILRREKPAVVHLIAMKPMVLGALAFRVAPVQNVICHFTGVGFLGTAEALPVRMVWNLVLMTVSRLSHRATAWFLFENPDDLDTVRRAGGGAVKRYSILGGAGVDPARFSVAPDDENSVPRIVFVGRLVWSKGADVAKAAHDRLREKFPGVQLHLFGRPDEDNPRAVTTEILRGWTSSASVVWHGHVGDVAEVWRQGDIAVVPSRGGEGLPRALLESAAACRPSVVSNVPGCRYFVRDGVEGLIVEPDRPDQLSAALEKLIADWKLRRRMGVDARVRLMSGFTVDHFRKEVQRVYEHALKSDFETLEANPGLAAIPEAPCCAPYTDSKKIASAAD